MADEKTPPDFNPSEPTSHVRITATSRPPTPRWAMENKDGITCYVYSPHKPEHFLGHGYTNVRAAGYYDHSRNVIVDPDDPNLPIQDERTTF